MVRKQQGFTIIELIVVIVILGILAAVAFPKFQDLSGDARTAVVNGAAAALKSAAVITYAKNQGSVSSATTIAGNVDKDTNVTFTVTSCTDILVRYLTTSSSVTVNLNATGSYCG